MSELAESLLKCKVEGNTLYLPPLSSGPLSNYGEVRTALLKAGAKYKKNAFIFPSDAQPFIDRLTSGESVNIQKEFQFFATPAKLADYIVELADIKEDHIVLEPSAGQGAIIKAINRVYPTMQVDYFEIMPENLTVLGKIENANLQGHDFLSDQENPKGRENYDRIIANPPFSKNQDIDHIRKMYECLKPGGRLVSIASPSWTYGSQKKQVAFKEWVEENGSYEDVPAGEFKESGTNIRTVIVVIDKK